jgi:Vitamin K-dependent gamma-carboxylase
MQYKSIVSRINKGYLLLTNKKNQQYLGFFRIAVGIVALLDLFSMRGGFSVFFSEKETIIPQKLEFLFTEYFDYLGPLYNFLEKNNELYLFYSTIIYVYVVFLIMVVLGIFTRFSAIIATLLQLVIFKSLAIYNFGYDHFLTMSLFYCIIFPVGKVKSVDNLIFKNNCSIKYNFNYQKIIQLHLTMVYVFSGLAKIVSKSWWDGVAIWRAISTVYDNYFKVPAIILAIVGILTILSETFYPFLVNFNKTRRMTVYAMICMHAFIAVVLELPFFAAIMIVWNITSYYEYFYKPKFVYE